MVRQSRHPKHIATALISTEEGDEVSIVVEGEHHRGTVVNASDGDRRHTRTIEHDSWRIRVIVDVSEDAEDHYSSSDEDFDVHTAVGGDVDAVLVWDGFELPDKHLSELDEDKRTEIEDGLTEQIEGLERALTEVQTLRDINRAVRDGEMTLQEMEERSYALEMDSGGRLALDQF